MAMRELCAEGRDMQPGVRCSGERSGDGKERRATVGLGARSEVQWGGQWRGQGARSEVQWGGQGAQGGGARSHE